MTVEETNVYCIVKQATLQCGRWLLAPVVYAYLDVSWSMNCGQGNEENIVMDVILPVL